MIEIKQQMEFEQISSKPGIMARGLWSNLYDWEDAAKEIAMGMDDGYIRDSIKYAPRNVWLIELTGGPGTECDGCPDYTYDDVVDKHWPALVGGVIKLAENKWPVAYVGFSNGARSALDALSNLSKKGSYNPAGYLSDGTAFALQDGMIDTYIGIGVPGAFDGNSPVAKILGANKDEINTNIQSRGLTHIRMGDIAPKYISNLIPGESRISFNLWKKYAELMNSTTDAQPGSGVVLDKVLIIAGTLFGTNDEIVPVNDVDTIYSNIGLNAGGRKVLVHIWDGHIGMPEAKVTKRTIKEFLSEDQLTVNIKNEVTS